MKLREERHSQKRKLYLCGKPSKLFVKKQESLQNLGEWGKKSGLKRKYALSMNFVKFPHTKELNHFFFLTGQVGRLEGSGAGVIFWLTVLLQSKGKKITAIRQKRLWWAMAQPGELGLPVVFSGELN